MSSIYETLHEHAARMAEREELRISPALGLLADMSDAELDELEFGVVKIDDHGFVESYNRYESRLTGLASEDAIGRHFFRDIAPCTNNALFRGLFERGLAENRLNHLFPYTFTYRMQPTNVKVHLFRDSVTCTNWVLISRV
ncbi:Photoactive yellow protein [Planctomycetes bacterium Pla163]|uniref:Photoactive yellow protein n=1 Tax=Rohdeia mirabilis TaxID=2528008 RepID=A0A518CZ29_9BACT|nr:Photoactive yellow protein [Planctomycetes bacterium Pla163]